MATCCGRQPAGIQRKQDVACPVNCSFRFSTFRPATLLPSCSQGVAPITIIKSRSHRRVESATATAQAVVSQSSGVNRDSRGHRDAAAANNQAFKESLEVLEWPTVCKQVACFCGTVMAAQRLVAGQLPLGASYQESQQLLQQTQEAVDAGLRVSGVFDIEPALQALESDPGAYLNAKQLEGVAATLEGALAVRAVATSAAQASGNGSGGGRSHGSGGGSTESSSSGARLLYPALAALAAPISPEEGVIARAVRHCIKLGSVADAASEALQKVRHERQANTEALRTLMDTLARTMYERGASDSRTVSIVRGRYCLALKAGRQSELPKGSVKLGSSQTGATVYYEPATAIPLNNASALLSEKEAEEERNVLVLLSRMLRERTSEVRALMEGVVALDIVAARAAHAAFFNAVRPVLLPPVSQLHLRHSSSSSPSQVQGVNGTFTSNGSGSHSSMASTSSLCVPGALHPLLLARGLGKPLPSPPSIDDNRFDRDFGAAPAWEPRRSTLGQSAAEIQGATSEPAAGSTLGPPKPLDLRVPADKAVVAVTGPNTGGKTAALKASGLLALMARAGLFLTVDHQQVSQHGAPRLRWFGSVLADIGDGQSLQQSLSTFGGHVRRLKQVLEAASPDSLVLLDEVGSGTDPVEGAALARAVLDALADRAGLTVATTHHAELKHAAEEDGRYVNACMEFDNVSLRPTYRLVWGAAGASNALAIAAALGFDSSVLAEAQAVARTTLEATADRAARLAATAASLVRQLEDTRVELEDAQARRADREAAAEELRAQVRELDLTERKIKALPRAIVRRRDDIRSRLDVAIAEVEAGAASREGVDALLKELEAQVPDLVAAHMNKAFQAEGDPEVGDIVVVPSKYGEDQFEVTAITGSGKLVIQPVGLLGVGLFALTMRGAGSRGKKGNGLTVPKSCARVAHRKPLKVALQQQGGSPAPIPKALDPSAPMPQAPLIPAAEPVTPGHTSAQQGATADGAGQQLSGQVHQAVPAGQLGSAPAASADSSHTAGSGGKVSHQQHRGVPVPGCYYSEGEEDEEDESGSEQH